MTGYQSKRAMAQDKLAQPEQETVAWPCVIAEANFEQNTITLEMQCSNYKVSAGKHWLSTTPLRPAQEPWRESASDYERGVIDGMQKQAQSSVDKAVNRMAQRTEERNFCPRCGKRTPDLETIHTCTPPQETTLEKI